MAQEQRKGEEYRVRVSKEGKVSRVSKGNSEANPLIPLILFPALDTF